jgi:hypothetical protein
VRIKSALQIASLPQEIHFSHFEVITCARSFSSHLKTVRFLMIRCMVGHWLSFSRVV